MASVVGVVSCVDTSCAQGKPLLLDPHVAGVRVAPESPTL